MCLRSHAEKKNRVGRSEIGFFFITKLILDNIYNAFLHLKSDIELVFVKIMIP